MYYTVLIGLISSLILGKIFLKQVQKRGYKQPIYEDAPNAHMQKAGTPTMGGLVFVIPFILIVNLTTMIDKSSVSLIYTITAIGFLLIGYKDDILKITNNKNESGFTPKQKLIFQFSIGIIVSNILYVSDQSSIIEIFGKNLELGFLYFLITPIVIVGFSNATNLTDGLDGLLTSISIIAFTTLGFIALIEGRLLVVLLISFVVGSLLGFLMFNFHPAKMFMGDTGSLFLGAVFAVTIIILKVEIIGLIIGSIYIIETLSVVIQVSYFKYTKSKSGIGKRIFLMAPLHHHFELKNYQEKQITFGFVFAQIIVSVVALFLYLP